MMFGEKWYELFEEVKKIFDPLGIFNPGKKTGGTMADIRTVDDKTRLATFTSSRGTDAEVLFDADDAFETVIDLLAITFDITDFIVQ